MAHLFKMQETLDAMDKQVAEVKAKVRCTKRVVACLPEACACVILVGRWACVA